MMTERRKEVMALADAVNELRKQLLVAVATLNEGITRLVEESERLLPATADEAMEARGASKVRRAVFQTHDPSPEDVATHTQTRRRTCSHCHEPGHRAPNCPKTALEKVHEKRRGK